jgi:hypothetical protein
MRFEIVGNKVVSDQYTDETLSVIGKIEKEFTGIVVGDGWLNIPIAKIGTISKIIVNATTANLRITYTDGGSQTMILPISGLFVYSVLASFSALITAIDISTDSTQVVDAVVSIYGV